MVLTDLGGWGPQSIQLVLGQFIIQLARFGCFTARWDSRHCRQLCLTTFKLTCGWAPPLPTSTGCHSRDEFSMALPVFRLPSTSLYCRQHKLENENHGRPRTRLIVGCFSLLEKRLVATPFTEWHFPCVLWPLTGNVQQLTCSFIANTRIKRH